MICVVFAGFSEEMLQKAMHDLCEAGFDSFETTLGGKGVCLEVVPSK